MKIAQTIRELRIFSISVTVFACICLWEALSWTFLLNPYNLSTQGVGLATAVLTALVALIKFCFTFAMEVPKQGDNSKINKE